MSERDDRPVDDDRVGWRFVPVATALLVTTTTIQYTNRRQRSLRQPVKLNGQKHLVIITEINVKYCFSFDMPSNLWRKRVTNFESKFTAFCLKV